jgi:hypothetical protein
MDQTFAGLLSFLIAKNQIREFRRFGWRASSLDCNKKAARQNKPLLGNHQGNHHE